MLHVHGRGSDGLGSRIPAGRTDWMTSGEVGDGRTDLKCKFACVGGQGDIGSWHWVGCGSVDADAC